MSKYIEVSGCGKCPNVGFMDSSRYSSECKIYCLHPDFTKERETATVKISSVNHNIYFNCPLPDLNDLNND